MIKNQLRQSRTFKLINNIQKLLNLRTLIAKGNNSSPLFLLQLIKLTYIITYYLPIIIFLL